MDDAYARLSIRCGYFAAAADAQLGRLHFYHLVHEHAWDLTEERLDAWKAEAVTLGVPAESLEPGDENTVTVLAKVGQRLQAQVDRTDC